MAYHGHSVPAGYFATPTVDTFNAYPQLWHRAIKERYPFAVINIVVTAIGGADDAEVGKRFTSDVLTLHRDLVTIAYALNDCRIGLERAKSSWQMMIAAAQTDQTRVLLVTPTPDTTQESGKPECDRQPLRDHSAQIRRLAEENKIGLVDSLGALDRFQSRSG